MRPLIEQQLVGRRLPLIMAHRGGLTGRENELETVRESILLRPDIIEVDVRKSRDGILYCHHGSGPWGVIAATFFGLLTFTQIRRLTGRRNTLRQLLDEVPDDILVYLDLKDWWITAGDLRPLVAGRRGVWIAPFGSVAWLRRLRAGLGDEHAYSLNRPLIFHRFGLKRLVGHADMIQLFAWSWTEKTVTTIESSGIICHLAEWFISRSAYPSAASLSRWCGFFVSGWDLRDGRHYGVTPTRRARLQHQASVAIDDLGPRSHDKAA